MFNRYELYNHLQENLPLFPEELLDELASVPKDLQHPCSSFFQKQCLLFQAEAKKVDLKELDPQNDRSFSLYFTTGDRVLYEKEYFARRRLLSALSLLSFFYPQAHQYLADLEQLIEYILSERTWCLPAHFYDVKGQAITPEENPYHLDLFACETGLALAEILSLQGNTLSLDLQSRIYLAIETRILDPFMNPKNYYGFENSRNNWSAVCAGAIGTLSMHLLNDKKELTNILHACLSSVDVYLSSFGEDGICTEGLSYWTYGFGFFTIFAEALYRKTDGALDLFQQPKVRAIAGSQQHQYLFHNYVISFSDSDPVDFYRLGLTSFLQRTYPEIRLPELSYALDFHRDHCGRYSLNLRDFLWTIQAPHFGLSDKDSRYFKDAQWLISKTRDNALVVKGGHNAESHNHNDVGSFLYYSGQIPILCDLGAGIYDKDYFSEKRYEAFCTHAASHNLPILNGYFQKEGESSQASEISFNLLDNVDTLSMNLTSCYEDPNLTGFYRCVSHRKLDACVVLKDCITFDEPGSVVENFITELEVDFNDGYLFFKKEGKIYSRMKVPSDCEVDLHHTLHTDHYGKEILLQIIQLHTQIPKQDHILELTFESVCFEQ